MSAAPQTSSVLVTAPAGVVFITIHEAARRSGYNLGYLRRRCGEAKRYGDETWLARGMAETRPPANGKGKPLWWIREDADQKFGRVTFAQHMTLDRRALTQRQRDVLEFRERTLKEWDAAIGKAISGGFTRGEATEQFVSLLRDLDGKRVSKTTLYRWAKDYAAEGPAGLLDERQGRTNQRAAEDAADPFLQECQRLYLRLSRPKLKTCFDHAVLTAEERRWPVRSFKKVQRHMGKLPAQVVIRFRMGEEEFEKKALPYMERDYTTLRVNQIWCADHHQLDVIASVDGKLIRPWLTAWEDLRSRKIVGWHLFAHDPNSNTILMSFRNGCLDAGVPESAYVDNGKDFDSYVLQGVTKFERRKIKVGFDAAKIGGVFGGLGVDCLHARPYNAKAKPIERFFNTLKTRFCQMFFATYVGGKPEEKPADLAEQLARGKAPKFADLVEMLGTWIDADYNARAHEGQAMDGKSPEAIFNELLEVKRTARTEELDLLLQKSSRPLKVGRNGVTWDGRTYGAPELYDAHFGKEVYLRSDPRDVTRVTVWTMQDKLICAATLNRRVPFGAEEQDYREAKSEHKRIRNKTREVHELGPKQYADVLELMSIRRDEQLQKGGGDQPAPPSLKPLQTPFTDQLPALARALGSGQMKTAVGAESITPSRSLTDVMNRVKEKAETGGGGDDFARLVQRSRQARSEEDE